MSWLTFFAIFSGGFVVGLVVLYLLFVFWIWNNFWFH